MKIRELFPPTIDGTAYLEITHRCNYKCRHCYAECPKPDEMSFSQVKQVARELKKYNFRKILLTGGEPLMVPHIRKTIDLLKKDFKVVLLTNGSLIRKTNLDYSKLDGVYVSFDGPTEKEHLQLRGRTGFNEVKENIKWLIKQNVKVAVGIIITKYNIAKIEQLINEAKGIGVDKINITVAQPFGRALKNRDITISQKKYLEMLPKLSKTKGIHFESMLCYPKELENNSKEVNELTLFEKYISGCAAGKKFIYISPEGYVTPCGYMTSDKKLLKLGGNIFKQDLKEIYKTPLFRFFMNRSWESVTGKCKACSYSVICKGGCPLRSYYLKGNPQMPDPWCMNHPENKEYLDYEVNVKNFEKAEVLC
jgi:radical SAM protein with 4Fe4S-binding SPASM domain